MNSLCKLFYMTYLIYWPLYVNEIVLITILLFM